ncbi:MAG: hypothetical protein BGO76_07610 [Caedibacter sp. 38-128]|nr:hypothetical protein [Holosporales bacterium]OJX04869.1 MAG: hypothetical protein BGO76_07610 [Caedibacter sp. 38-128]
MKKRLMLVCSTFALCYSSYGDATDISPAMRKNAEDVIASCEKTYQNVKAQGQRIDNIKKPTLLSSKKTKENYKNKEVYKRAFNLRFAEFTKFTGDKIKIRTAKEPSKFRDEVNAYSSNCTRFAGGLVQFVDWAVAGKPIDKISETIFKDWMIEAK